MSLSLMVGPETAHAERDDAFVVKELRTLQPGDVPSMVSLIHGPGVRWQQTDQDVRRLIEERSAAGAISDDGVLASMAALRTWSGPRGGWGWLSFVCTLPRARRRGLARRLVEMQLEKIGDIPVGLYGGGVALGLYRSLGFESRGTGMLLRRNSAPPSDVSFNIRAHAMRATSKGALPASVIATDAEMYGANRTADLQSWLENSGTCVFLPSGAYAFSRSRFPDGLWIGPVVGKSPEDVSTLLQELLYDAPEGPIEMIVPPGAPKEMINITSALGFKVLGSTEFMTRGGDVAPMALTHPRLRLFAATGYEYG